MANDTIQEAAGLAALIGGKLPPNVFFLYIEDYARNNDTNQYNFTEKEIDTIRHIWGEIQEFRIDGMMAPDEFKIIESDIYIEYLKH